MTVLSLSYLLRRSSAEFVVFGIMCMLPSKRLWSYQRQLPRGHKQPSSTQPSASRLIKQQDTTEPVMCVGTYQRL